MTNLSQLAVSMRCMHLSLPPSFEPDVVWSMRSSPPKEANCNILQKDSPSINTPKVALLIAKLPQNGSREVCRKIGSGSYLSASIESETLFRTVRVLQYRRRPCNIDHDQFYLVSGKPR